MTDAGGPPAKPPADDVATFVRRLEAALPEMTERVIERFDQAKAAAEHKKKELEIGWVASALIGDKDHAPTRIAFWVIVCSLILIVIGMVLSIQPLRVQADQLIDKIVSAAFSLAAGALGYVFGRSKR